MFYLLYIFKKQYALLIRNYLYLYTHFPYRDFSAFNGKPQTVLQWPRFLLFLECINYTRYIFFIYITA